MSELRIKTPGIKHEFNDKVWQSWRMNCYAFALDCPDLGWAEPGFLRENDKTAYSDQELDSLYNAQSYTALMLKDGFTQVEDASALCDEFHVVALCYASSSPANFHFYRKEHIGNRVLWTHKDGIEGPRKLHAAPDAYNTANAPYYDRFVGYFAVPDDGVLYLPRNIF